MSLFEKIQNKRYDLQEVTKKFQTPPDPWVDDSTVKTQTNTVKQSEVSKKAKKYTDKINKQNKNLTRGFEDVTGEGKVKYPKTRKELIAKRKEYGIDRKGNIGDDGVKRYAQKTKELSSGSNLPVKPTKKELDIAKTRAVGGKPVLGKGSKGVKDKVVGTTTGKYGGRLARARNKNLPSYADVKAKIDAKNPTYKSPDTGGKLPLSTRKYSSPVDKFNKMIERGKKIDPVGTTKALQNMPDVDMPKTVLKVRKPGSTFKKSKFKGFDEVPTSDPVGKKIYKKWDTSGFETPKPPLKKPNVFQRAMKKLTTGWSVPKKDWDLKPTRWDKAGNVLAQQRRTFPKTIRGSIRKNLAKLPNRYKALAVAAVGTSYAVDHVLNRKKKQQEAEKKANILPSGNDRTKIYTSPTVSLKLDNRKPGK